MTDELLEIHRLKKYFPLKKGLFGRASVAHKAVDDVSFSILRGETFGLVGESGSGKSTIGRAILRLIEPTAGRVFIEGKDVTAMSPKELRSLRKEAQMIFQDPFASLNPRHTVGKILEEPFIIHSDLSAAERSRRVRELLDIVGLDRFHAKRFPHQFSGGQRQRIGIARALAVRPKLIVADEPVSALDVSIQSQIINLLRDLQEKFELTYLFIAHDLSVVKHFCDRVGVMRAGRLVELSTKREIYHQPLHPYTKALLSSAPIPDPDAKRERIVLRNASFSSGADIGGCSFHPYCPYVFNRCKMDRPLLKKTGNDQYVACHLYD